MRSDQGMSWITTGLAVFAVITLVGAMILSASGPGINPSHRGLFGSAEPSEAAKALDRGDTFLFGVWLGDWPSEESRLVDEYEETTGTNVDIVDIYLDWSTPADNLTHSISHVTKEGAIPHLTWEPRGVTTQELLEGEKTLSMRGGGTLTVDAYVTEFAAGVCEISERTGDPVLVRPMHEMNGGWFDWGIDYKTHDGSYPNTNESYKQAFRKLHDAFEAACANGGDVRIVWAPNHESVGKNTSFMGTYPGDAYVDYVGIDGYNWGSAANWGWKPFSTIFDRAYCEISAATDRPIFISEWGSVEQGGDKGAWIEQALDRMADGAYPEVRAMIWLNDLKHEPVVHGAVDWRVNSSPEALQAYEEGIENVRATWTPHYQPGGATDVCA